MDTKFRCKIGDVEVEYEGSISFLKEDVPNLIEKIRDAAKQHTGRQTVSRDPTGTPQISAHSTNTIASLMSAKTGTDLVISACANLTFTKGQNVSSRKDILNEMQEATTFYKGSYSANLSKSLDSLVKQRKLNLVSRNNYALSPNERQKLGEIIAQHQ